MYLPIEWNKSSLVDILDSRIDYLIRQRFTQQKVTHRDLLPPKIGKKSSLAYILERSMMRPRDVIMFFNCCIKNAPGQFKIGVQRLREAEGEYSRNRLRSLADEWTSDYPNLMHFTEMLRSRKPLFPATEITDQDIEDICYEFCDDPPRPVRDDILLTSANRLVDADADHEFFRKTVLQVFYRTGLIGLKLETFETVQWTTLGARSVSKAEISNRCKVAIHPMFWRVFGVRVN